MVLDVEFNAGVGVEERSSSGWILLRVWPRGMANRVRRCVLLAPVANNVVDSVEWRRVRHAVDNAGKLDRGA